MEEYQVFDPKGVMQQVTKQTHYMPKHWRGAENTEAVRAEFEGHFQVHCGEVGVWLLGCIYL